MTPSIDAPTTPQKKSSANIANPSPKPASRPKRFYAFAVIALISIIALGSAFYAIGNNVQLTYSTEQQIDNLRSQIDMLKRQQHEVQTQWNTTLSSIHESQDKLQEKINTADERIEASLQQNQYQAKDWLLLKARHYLELAQINAQWSDNWQTTLALLQQADALLANMHEQRLFNVRKAIASEIAGLKALPKPDTAGLLSQLDSALEVITQLPLKPAVTKEEDTVDSTTPEKILTWQKRFKENIGLLEKLVVVRRHNENILPLPSPLYEAMLREGIRLNLQEAQWAVLQSNEVVYQFSLTQAVNNIRRSFEINASVTSALVKQLQDLQQIHLIQQKPLLEESLPLLNQAIDGKVSQAIDKKPSGKGGNS